MDIKDKDSKWLLEDKYSGVKSPEYLKDVKRLESGEPLAYVIGYVDFLDVKVDLSLKPLIPRDETEFWVESVLKELDQRKPIAILDMFSGSGCIGLSALKKLENASVTFSDVEDSCLKQIRKNIVLNNFQERDISVVESNVFDSIEGKFDIIFANPPYIDPKKRDLTQESVTKFEPHSALFAEKDGMAFVKQLVDESREYLNDSGRIYIEFDSWQSSLLEQYLNGSDWRSFNILEDHYGHPRVLELIND